MLTHKKVVINNVIIHAKWGKQFNGVKAIMTSIDKVNILALLKASCFDHMSLMREFIIPKPVFTEKCWSVSFIYLFFSFRARLSYANLSKTD